MKDRKGFSLIELLAALVIIGLILLIVIPAASRLLTSNDVKEYKNYVTLVEAGAKTYANELKDSLGSSMDKGCTEVTLDELIKKEMVKPFNDKKVTCSGKVRLNNNKGKLDVSLNLTCIDDKGKETFKKTEIENSSCIAFVHKEEGALGTKIKKNGVGAGSISTVGGNTYVRGTSTSDPSNYVWYSGNLWRVVYYNNKEIKLVSNDIVTVIPRNNTTDVQYKNSLVHKWLENIFLNSLKQPSKYLTDSDWNMTPTGGASFTPSNDKTYIVTSKVGLLNTFESFKIGGYLDKDITWLMGNPSTNSNKLWIRKGSSTTEKIYSKDNYYNIRAAITMNPDVMVVSGNGSLETPYVLEGNSTNVAKNTLINTRYSGEYVKVNGVLYRIVTTSGGLTKIIMVDTLQQTSIYSDNADIYNFSYTKLYSSLQDWYRSDLGASQNLIFEKGSWCLRVLDNTTKFLTNPLSTCERDIFTSPVGLPSIGELYTTNFDGKKNMFWTLDVPNTTEETKKIWTVVQGANASQTEKREVTSFAYVKPVMYLKNNVVITSGEGTKAKPFELGLK